MRWLAFTTMLSLDLGRLGREGSVLVEARLPADAPLWEGSNIAWAGPVGVRLNVTNAGTGEIVVRGTVEGAVALECRRCLEPVVGSVEQEVTIVFVAADTPGAEADDGMYLFESSGELDVSRALREEVLLAVNSYVVCRPDCQGLCPTCGVNRNTDSCACEEDEADPRWEALRALKNR